MIYVHSTVKCRPRQSYRVCSCCDISRTSSRPAYDSRISCCYSRANSARVLIVVVCCYTVGIFSPSVLSGTVQIRRRGPHLQHSFFFRSVECRKNFNKTKTAPGAPGISRKHIFHVVLLIGTTVRIPPVVLLTPNLPARPHNDNATATPRIRSRLATAHPAGGRRRFGRHAAARAAAADRQR